MDKFKQLDKFIMGREGVPEAHAMDLAASMVLERDITHEQASYTVRISIRCKMDNKVCRGQCGAFSDLKDSDMLGRSCSGVQGRLRIVL